MTSEYILASRENDWDNEDIVCIEGKLYLRVKNGGSEGGQDKFRPTVELLQRGEAVRLMLEYGMEPEEITTALAGVL